MIADHPPHPTPCLPGCWHCPPHTMRLATAALVYLLACLSYLIMTLSVGTPFADSLTPEQRAIKRASARRRGIIFLQSLVVASVAVRVWRPFTRFKLD